VKRTFDLIELDASVGREEISVLDGYRGTAYTVPLPDGMKAICHLAEVEGLMLDLCYTGKAMAGTLVLVKRKFQAREISFLLILVVRSEYLHVTSCLAALDKKICCG
jgi:L-cysteate sulfo-lyase